MAKRTLSERAPATETKKERKKPVRRKITYRLEIGDTQEDGTTNNWQVVESFDSQNDAIKYAKLFRTHKEIDLDEQSFGVVKVISQPDRETLTLN